MFLDRWRAQRGLLTRSPPSTITDPPPARLTAAVEALKPLLGADESMGDPTWHHRWDGALQLVGLDATERSVSDVRQRLVRLIHECDLGHMARRRRRVLAVVLCRPDAGDLRSWHAALDDDQGEVGPSVWRAARRRIGVLALDEQGGAQLFGGDRSIEKAVLSWIDAENTTD